MEVLDKLIVSPTNVKFQAPFPHNQKRQLSLLNVSDKDLVYSIELDNEELFQVIPSRGSLDAYDTIELTILMKPATRSLSTCVMKVKYMLKPEDESDEEQSDRSDKTVEDPAMNSSADWSESHKAQVNISLENCVETEEEMRQMFALDNSAESVARILEKNYQPVCTNCCLKRTNPSDLAKTPSWQRLFFWPTCFALFSLAGKLCCLFFGACIVTFISIAVYFGCEFLGLKIFDLNSERIY